MSGSGVDQLFVESKALPFDFYEPLFSWILERPEFRQWLLPECAWQLRLIGGPGSGKTTLSSWAVKHLRDRFSGPDDRVVSIFFTHTSQVDGDTLAYCLLRETFRQLSGLPGDKSRSTSPNDSSTPDVSAPLELSALRNVLVAKLSQLSRTFLVLDDVDLCSQEQWNVVEAEFAGLQLHGLKVMVTSRLSLWHELPAASCDTGWPPEHGNHSTNLFWYCACQDSIEEATIVCQRCKDDGYTCEECNQNTDFIEPYDHVDLSIDNDEDESIMSTYVSRMLEIVHGDLGLASSACPKPVHSKLGRALIAAQTAAAQLRDKIVTEAEGNIGMAKLRLESIDGATTIEEVVRYGDRLPASIVSMFDSGIAGIRSRGSQIEDLGLKALVGVANEFHQRPFPDLQRWLRKQIKKEHYHQTETADLSIEQVLRAAAGFIKVENTSDRPVELYHGALEYYVAERYNEALFWAHTSTITIDAEEFARPKRVQTWHASRRHPTRADTWK